jgi:hypothetical protein
VVSQEKIGLILIVSISSTANHAKYMPAIEYQIGGFARCSFKRDSP